MLSAHKFWFLFSWYFYVNLSEVDWSVVPWLPLWWRCMWGQIWLTYKCSSLNRINLRPLHMFSWIWKGKERKYCTDGVWWTWLSKAWYWWEERIPCSPLGHCHSKHSCRSYYVVLWDQNCCAFWPAHLFLLWLCLWPSKHFFRFFTLSVVCITALDHWWCFFSLLSPVTQSSALIFMWLATCIAFVLALWKILSDLRLWRRLLGNHNA